jgi:hypothetical protein
MRKLVVATVVAGAALVAAAAGPAVAQTVDDGPGRDPRTITVYASGLVRGVPDVMELTLGVDTRARSAAEALGRNSELARKVIDVLREAGVAEPDVQTSDLSVAPVYDDDGAEVIAYAVSNLVSAKIRDLDRVGTVVDAAAEVAGDEIVVNGLYFSFDDNTELVARARKDAVERARAQAEQLAKAAGVELGSLLSLTEDSAPVGRAIEADESTHAAAPDAAPPVNPGSQTLSVQVTLVYEIR